MSSCGSVDVVQVPALHSEGVSVDFSGFLMAYREVILNESCRGSARTGSKGFMTSSLELVCFAFALCDSSLGFYSLCD